MVNILVVEDDTSIRKLMKVILTMEGYNVILAENGEVALAIMENNKVDLAIVDIMMPKINGYQLVSDLRATNFQFPIMMVSAKSDISDKKHGFKMGIDDYMTKPFDEEELLLRIKALLRRAQIATEGKIIVENMIVDYSLHSVKINNEEIILSQKEFLLLYKLLSYPNKIFTKFELFDEIWGYNCDSDSATVKVHIGRLRKKLENAEGIKIVTVKNLGYKVVRNE